jgi:hypothetical protein
MSFFDLFSFVKKEIEGPTSPPKHIEEIHEVAKAIVADSSTKPNPSIEQCRRWRLTRYLVADENDSQGATIVPVKNGAGEFICYVPASFFSFMSLQGTGKLKNGTLINVTGEWLTCSHAEYGAVLDYHKKYMSKRPFGYSGIKVNSGGQVYQALTFAMIPRERLGKGYGIQHGVPLDPFRTLAADIGCTKKSDPKFKGTGGVVPLGTDVLIKEFVGIKLPDGSTHDGWFKVCDTGGGIFGAHFDVFAGTRGLDKRVNTPNHGHIWFEGIEDKIPKDYSYGIEDV